MLVVIKKKLNIELLFGLFGIRPTMQPVIILQDSGD
ncbi:MAG: hypothetical protein CM15mP126_3060 [Gammaproteobacteria bacterium]|nr:MAG: hypothetical protein CM15mP126_3060 [Gammaproteobacteria bacterium]